MEDTGLEPVTSCVQDKRSPKTELIPQIKTPNAFYSRSSGIKSVSQNYRIPSIYINNVIFILRTSYLMLILSSLGKFAVKSVLLKYQNTKSWNCYDTTQQAY